MENVSEYLQTKQQGMFEKVSSNKEVAGLLMTLLANLVILANRKGVPIEGIEFDPPQENFGDVTARLKFNSLSIPSAQVWSAQNDFQRYTAQYSAHLWKALDKNPRIGLFFEKFINLLERYAQRKRIDFKDLSFKKALITKENVLVIKMGKETLDKWDR